MFTISCSNRKPCSHKKLYQLCDPSYILPSTPVCNYAKPMPRLRFSDFCPLCGSRFYGNDPEEMANIICEHVDNKTCQNNFRPLAIALADKGQDL